MGPSHGATAAVGVTFAAIAASASLFGIPLLTVLLGAGGCALGVFGRCGYDIQRTLSRGATVYFARIAGWAFAGFMLAPMSAVLVMAGLKRIGLDTDGAVIFGLLTIGFGGQDIIGWIWTFGITQLNKRFGLNVPIGLPGNIGGPNGSP